MRVRKESFGLLFYNTMDNMLTFVKSGTLLEPVFYSEDSNMLQLSDLSPAGTGTVKKLIRDLIKKGIIIERGSCV